MGLFSDAGINSEYVASIDSMISEEWIGCGWKRSWPNFKLELLTDGGRGFDRRYIMIIGGFCNFSKVKG
jgi:hypothetical protein